MTSLAFWGQTILAINTASGWGQQGCYFQTVRFIVTTNSAKTSSKKKSSQRQFFVFFCIFSNIWPLARPNIAKRKPLWQKKAANFEMLVSGAPGARNQHLGAWRRLLAQKGQFCFHFFTIFLASFPYIWPLAGPNIAKRVGRCKNWRGVIDKPILELLTFESNLDFSDFGSFFMIFGSPGRLR